MDKYINKILLCLIFLSLFMPWFILSNEINSIKGFEIVLANDSLIMYFMFLLFVESSSSRTSEKVKNILLFCGYLSTVVIYIYIFITNQDPANPSLIYNALEKIDLLKNFSNSKSGFFTSFAINILGLIIYGVKFKKTLKGYKIFQTVNFIFLSIFLILLSLNFPFYEKGGLMGFTSLEALELMPVSIIGLGFICYGLYAVIQNMDYSYYFIFLGFLCSLISLVVFYYTIDFYIFILNKNIKIGFYMMFFSTLLGIFSTFGKLIKK